MIIHMAALFTCCYKGEASMDIKHILILLVCIYFILINVVTFFAFMIDKKKAEKKKWRIPEATLLGLAAIGGPVGGLLGMNICHHKTKKPKFYITMPILMIIWLGIVGTLIYIMIKLNYFY